MTGFLVKPHRVARGDLSISHYDYYENEDIFSFVFKSEVKEKKYLIETCRSNNKHINKNEKETISTYMQLCKAADHKTTKRLQFVQVGAQSEDASGKRPGILIA